MGPQNYPQGCAPDPSWAVGGRLVRAMVQSSAVPSEPGAPIGAHSSGGGRGQQGGLPLGRVGISVATEKHVTGQSRHACGHWPVGVGRVGNA